MLAILFYSLFTATAVWGQAFQGIGISAQNEKTDSLYKFTANNGYVPPDHTVRIDSKGSGFTLDYQLPLNTQLSYVPYLTMTKQKPSKFVVKGSDSSLATTTWETFARTEVGIEIRIWIWEYFFFGGNINFSTAKLSKPSDSTSKIGSMFASGKGAVIGMEHGFGPYLVIRHNSSEGEFKRGQYRGKNTVAALGYRF